MARFSACALLCLALGARAAAAEERLPFNGAVHSDPGAEVVDDGMTEEAGVHETDRWVSLQLYPGFFTPKSWQAPQYRNATTLRSTLGRCFSLGGERFDRSRPGQQ